jgi:preprotein translocase SecE subunit
MARDRKRAKQRQRRRAGQQQKQSQQRQASPAPERQASPAPVPEAGSIDPLGQAAPEAEIAELAETGIQEPGAPVGEPLGEKDYPHPDELEGADVIEAVEEEEAAAEEDEPAAAAPARRRAAAPGGELPKEGNRFVNFLRACWAELRRVQWPNRRQVGQATAVVLVFVLIAGGYLGVMDAIFSRLVDAIL